MEAGIEIDSPEAKDHVETLRRLNDDCIKSVVHVDERCRLRSAGPGGLARCDGAADEVGYYTGKRRLPGETEQERLGLVRGCNFPPAQTDLRFHLQGESLALRDAVCDHHSCIRRVRSRRVAVRRQVSHGDGVIAYPTRRPALHWHPYVPDSGTVTV